MSRRLVANDQEARSSVIENQALQLAPYTTIRCAKSTGTGSYLPRVLATASAVIERGAAWKRLWLMIDMKRLVVGDDVERCL
jgi:hypothetical protein